MGKPPVEEVACFSEGMTGEVVKAAAKPPVLEVVFDNKGTLKPFIFDKAPLGMKLSQTKPRFIGKMGMVKVVGFESASFAKELGVKKGWLLKSIAGVDVSKRNAKEVEGMLKEYTVQLPTIEKSVVGAELAPPSKDNLLKEPMAGTGASEHEAPKGVAKVEVRAKVEPQNEEGPTEKKVAAVCGESPTEEKATDTQ